MPVPNWLRDSHEYSVAQLGGIFADWDKNVRTGVLGNGTRFYSDLCGHDLGGYQNKFRGVEAED